MGDIVLAGATSGTTTLTPTAVSGTTTLTLPATTGTVVTKDTNGILSVNGVQFPATQSASANANTLDDYEEGTWTPGFTNFSGTTGWTFSNSTYTKIGRTVFLNCLISPGAGTLTATSNSGLITGLPFNVGGANSPIPWASNYIETLGTGIIYGADGIYSPTLSVANTKTIYFAGSYITST
jgi:hypothetical protein